MSQADAALLLGGFSSFILTLAHAWMKSNILPDWVKFIVAIVLSLIGGILTALAGGQFVSTLSIIQTASIICTAAIGIYTVAFKEFNLEKVLFPRASVITAAQKSVAGQINMMSTQTIKNAVDPASSTVISVRAESVTYTGPEIHSVMPQG